jgi:hypothetical protein
VRWEFDRAGEAGRIEPVGQDSSRRGAVLDVPGPVETRNAAPSLRVLATRSIRVRDHVRQGRVEHRAGIRPGPREVAPVIRVRTLKHERRFRTSLRAWLKAGCRPLTADY